MTDNETRRQVLYWRLLAGIFVDEPQLALETVSAAVVDEAGLPPALLDARVSVDTVVQRYPELGPEFEGIDLTGPDDAAPGADPDGIEAGEAHSGTPDSNEAGADALDSGPLGSDERAGIETVGDHEVRTAALASKLLLNIFATGSGAVSATQLSAWQADAAWLRRALGTEGAGELRTVLADLEAGLVERMRLREVLADPHLAAQLSPSMSLVEQLLRDKHNLSGLALANAKALIRRFVDEVAAVLRTQVQQSTVGSPDRSIPPKRILRNLDMDRTIWKNLPNWSPQDQRLYVDRLYYRQTAKRTVPARMIVVVDQSGSMVDAMVNCTILASIFAGLPKVDVHLIAYDTDALDLSPWVHDPFEVLLRTQLGGGTDGRVAMTLAQPKVADPKNTVVVWISDFYEWQGQELFESMAALYRSGVKFIPVGSVGSSGQQSVNPWFRERFKNLGTPVLSGRINKLVNELKNFLD
ncbi:vWA domain-containing protein [Nocardia stercoris]|uniref:VWA domain-containing protein n=1 Tax=Nocardia stercoris TaxID=2483361 RepID=A0A3M2LD21_9NOCA|nr:VWA domain-containing protein [Nocardia stercoris]RMI32588.1 VWA domain-containing protein [Nocardia stercoris]